MAQPTVFVLGHSILESMEAGDEIGLLCQEARALRLRGQAMAEQIAQQVAQLRQLRERRSELRRWSNELLAETPTEKNSGAPAKREPDPH